MSTPIIAKYALRTLGRNVRRTLLSVVGIGVGVFITVFMTAFMRGSTQMRVRSIAESGFGHVKVAPADWLRSRDSDLRLTDWETELAAVRATDGVAIAAPHARSTALLAFGTRVSGVEMLGVDPEAETESSRLVRAIGEGRYLEDGDRDVVVVGRTIADRLEVELDDDLLLTVVDAEGEMEYSMLRIVGIIETGSRDMDATVCHVMLDDVERLTGLPGAGEISVTLEDPFAMDAMTSRLKEVVSVQDDVFTWMVVLPAQGGDYESDKGFMNILAATVVVVAILGIAGAQLTAILERRREFAVLIALGMKSSQVVRLILLEAVVMGAMGAVIGLLLAWAPLHLTATRGFDFSAAMGGDLSMSGVLFEPVVYSVPGTWVFPYAFVIALISTLIAAIYPALFALQDRSHFRTESEGGIDVGHSRQRQRRHEGLPSGEDRGQRAARSRSRDPQGRLPRDRRPKRQRQDHASQPHRRARYGDRRVGGGVRRGPLGDGTPEARGAEAAVARLRVSGIQPRARADGARERRVRPGAAGQRRRPSRHRDVRAERPGPRRSRRQAAERDVRRTAAARRRRQGRRVEAAPRARRRADREPRQRERRVAPQDDAGASRRARHDVRLLHARPSGGLVRVAGWSRCATARSSATSGRTQGSRPRATRPPAGRASTDDAVRPRSKR